MASSYGLPSYNYADSSMASSYELLIYNYAVWSISTINMIYFFTYCTVWSTFCSYSSCILLCSLINNGLWLLLIIAQSGQWLAVMGYLLTVVQSGQWLVVMIT